MDTYKPLQAVAYFVRLYVVCAWLSRHPMRLQEYVDAAVVQDICPALVWQRWCPKHCSQLHPEVFEKITQVVPARRPGVLDDNV